MWFPYLFASIYVFLLISKVTGHIHRYILISLSIKVNMCFERVLHVYGYIFSGVLSCERVLLWFCACSVNPYANASIKFKGLFLCLPQASDLLGPAIVSGWMPNRNYTKIRWWWCIFFLFWDFVSFLCIFFF